jgi:peptidoglycan hydrolase CwlO-like protein
MKNFILFLLLLLAVPGFSQKKGKVDPKDAQIDSLMQATAMLTSKVDSLSIQSHSLSMKLDSVSKEKDRYYQVYKTVSEKVVRYKFDPSKTSTVIDSMKMDHETTMSTLTTTSAEMTDSVRILKAENAKLQNGLQDMADSQVDKEKIIVELKQLKDLLDEKIITQEEYNVKKTKLLAKWE